jgi:cobalamin biosynthesis Mg chelatase CobN
MFALSVTVPVASAATNAPAGNSGLSQYLEVVPGSSGSTPSKGGKSKSTLTAAQQKALRKTAAGRSLTEFADKTSPATHRTGSVGAKDPTGRAKALAATAVGGNDDAGLGIWLPILMVIAALFAITVAWRRRASGTSV